MNHSKQNRRLKSFWYKKDIKGWIKFIYKIGRLIDGKDDSIFERHMTVWNVLFTHEDILKNHYDGWKPYCCSNIPCESSVLDRMERTDFGWECPFCKTITGKHLFAIKRTSYGPVRFAGGWDNYYGIPKTNRFRLHYPGVE